MPSTNPVFIEQTSKICCYFNSTNKIQIIKVIKNNASLEKIVFPKQRILFESSQREIEVYLQQNGQPILKNVSSYIDINIEKYSKKPIAV